jgi:hypothetical protein
MSHRIIKGRLTDSRHVELDEPVQDAQQVVEVIVQATSSPGETVGEFLARLPAGTRTRREIDAELNRDRNAWDQRA